MEKQETKKTRKALKEKKNNTEKKGTKPKQAHLGVYFDPDLHKEIKAICKEECRSMRGLILYLLRQYVINFKKTHENFDFDK